MLTFQELQKLNAVDTAYLPQAVQDKIATYERLRSELTTAREAVGAAKAKFQQADQADIQAHANAARTGTKPPASKVEAAQRDLSAAERTVEVLKTAIVDAQSDLVSTVDGDLPTLRATLDERLIQEQEKAAALIVKTIDAVAKVEATVKAINWTVSPVAHTPRALGGDNPVVQKVPLPYGYNGLNKTLAKALEDEPLSTQDEMRYQVVAS